MRTPIKNESKNSANFAYYPCFFYSTTKNDFKAISHKISPNYSSSEPTPPLDQSLCGQTNNINNQCDKIQCVENDQCETK